MNQGGLLVNSQKSQPNSSHSNLVRTLLNSLKPKATGGNHLLPFSLLQKAGNLTYNQLSNLRHRGAFSTVSLTFARCCQVTQDGKHDLTVKSQELDLEDVNGPDRLIKQWYQVRSASNYIWKATNAA
jgi:hypothetical protein